MTYKAETIEEYCGQIPADRKEIFVKFLEVIRQNLPKGFEEGMQYAMPSFFVSKSIYPKGYHVNPSLSLPFVAVASQKGFVAFHHLGIYMQPALSDWFVTEYQKQTGKKPDMGKGCIRFKKPELIPLKLMGELCSKMLVTEFVEIYENSLKK